MKGICDDMNKKIKTPEVEQLFKGMLCLKSVEECYEFFEDICTINELLSLSQRFEVARMLREKKTYLEIAEKTGASTATNHACIRFYFRTDFLAAYAVYRFVNNDNIR